MSRYLEACCMFGFSSESKQTVFSDPQSTNNLDDPRPEFKLRKAQSQFKSMQKYGKHREKEKVARRM